MPMGTMPTILPHLIESHFEGKRIKDVKVYVKYAEFTFTDGTKVKVIAGEKDNDPYLYSVDITD